MITTKQLTTEFERDLNALIATSDMPGKENIAFKIWADVGAHRKPRRTANKVDYYVEGVLKSTASSLEANTLIMGVNSFMLDFAVPILPPRTDMAQTEAELEAVQDDQFIMPAFIIGILSQYFQRPKQLSLTDEQNINFGVGVMGGIAQPNNVEIIPGIGKSMHVSVYINANIVENGVVSTAVTVSIDGQVLPAQNKTFSRSAVLNNDVISDTLVAKSIETSSAFAVQVNFPANSDDATKEAIKVLLRGGNNRAHFVTLKYGSVAEEDYFMLMARVNSAAEDVQVAGLTVEFAEVIRYIESLSVPESYQVGAFVTTDTHFKKIMFRSSVATKAFMGGKVIELPAAIKNYHLTPDDYYDNDGEYLIYIITQKATTLSPTTPGVTYRPIKAAQNE